MWPWCGLNGPVLSARVRGVPVKASCCLQCPECRPSPRRCCRGHGAMAGTRGCAGVLQCGCPGSLIPFMQWYAGPKVMCETSNDYNLDKRQLKDSWLLMERRFKSLQISPDCSSRDPLLNFWVSSRHLNNISIFSYFQGKIIPTPIAHASTYRCPNLLSNFVYKFWWVH